MVICFGVVVLIVDFGSVGTGVFVARCLGVGWVCVGGLVVMALGLVRCSLGCVCCGFCGCGL